MISVNLLLATAGLLPAISAAVFPGIKTVLVNNIVIPKTKSDFAKNNVTATWAPSYPKEWGSEDLHYQLNEPDPEDNFNAVVTEDQKYLVMTNGTYIEFVDLERNTIASGFAMEVPDKQFTVAFTVRPATTGYDVFWGTSPYRYNSPENTTRQRVGTDLNPIEKPIVYEGPIGAISKQNKLASLAGQVYDLNTNSEAPIATLEGQPAISDLSFSPDGVHLSSVSWQAMTADLWNATSGARIFSFPATKSQNWRTLFSPDGKYIAIALGASKNTIQVYALSNLTAAPVELKGFNDWPRELAWSPDSTQIAVGDDGRLQIFEFPSTKVVQTWEIDSVTSLPVTPVDIQWTEDGKRIAWQWREAFYLYDFEANTEWLCNIGVTDHIWGNMGYYLLKDYAVTMGGDSVVRFWKTS